MSSAHKFQWPTVFSGLRGIKAADLPREISAGITLAALIIPLNIGYAQVAGLPPVFGLYAGIIPLTIFAIFTSSCHVVGSPDAPISAILGALLIGFAPIGDPLRLQYALALALLCGLLFFSVVLAVSPGFSRQFSVSGSVGRSNGHPTTTGARRLPLTPRVIFWNSSPAYLSDS